MSQIAVAPTPLTKTVTDNVYVKPTPKPRVIHIKKRVVAASHRQQVVTVVQSMRSGESDMSENERENGD